ncbi:MAG: hypothetical protein AAGF31_02690 [Planctomycetota bacterium]
MKRHSHQGDDLPEDDFLPGDLAKIESLVRAAGDYVQPSDDLRPRLLESARGERQLRRRRWVATRVCAAAAAIGLLVGPQIVSHRSAMAEASQRERIARAVVAQQQNAHRSGVDSVYWELVNAFWQVRQEQSESLRALTGPSNAGQRSTAQSSTGQGDAGEQNASPDSEQVSTQNATPGALE